MKILNKYIFGSHVYGTANVNSDIDYIIVVDGYNGIIEQTKDYQLYDIKSFQDKLNKHSIEALECLFAPKQFVIQQDMEFDFTLDLWELRKSICAIAHNSFDKARKKLIIEKDFNPYVAKKSLFHSFRIIMFGIQIAKYGKIINFSEANDIYKQIFDIKSNDWEIFKDKFKPPLNDLLTEFRIHAPKQ